jgi:hypothetical protein
VVQAAHVNRRSDSFLSHTVLKFWPTIISVSL